MLDKVLDEVCMQLKHWKPNTGIFYTFIKA